jgi:hypothetical protein
MTALRLLDGRHARFRVLPEASALDYANDVTALAQEGRLHLARAYDAHVQSDWARYLQATEAINAKLIAIGKVAREWAGAVEDAPTVSRGQLSLCSDGLAGPGGHAS